MKKMCYILIFGGLLFACKNPRFEQMQDTLAQYSQMIELFAANADSILAQSDDAVSFSQLRKRYQDSSVTWKQRLSSQFADAQFNNSDKSVILNSWAQIESKWIDTHIDLEKKVAAHQINRLNKSLQLLEHSDSLVHSAKIDFWGLQEIAQETLQMNRETREMALLQMNRTTHYRDSMVGVLSERKVVLSKQPEILIR